MDIPGITWRGGSIEDAEILKELPADYARILCETNGFILRNGALHIRGACIEPEWHSLRNAWRGTNAFHKLYSSVQKTDIPFAQDQLGDQFLLRNKEVFRLMAETGDLEQAAENLEEFFQRVTEDTEGFLNVSSNHPLLPGDLLLAYPPFVFAEAAEGPLLKPLKACEVILFHADLARRIRDLPEGGTIEFKIRT
jgi:hypothetical protein